MLEPTPVDVAAVECPNCLSVNNKSHGVKQMADKLQAGRQLERALFMAKCSECSHPLMLLIGSDGTTSLAVMPGEDTEEAAADAQFASAVGMPRNSREAQRLVDEANRCFEDGKYPQAYEAWTAACNWYGRLASERATVCALMSNAGTASLQLKQYHKALSCFQTALTGIGEDNDPEGLATILNNIGFTYLKLGDWDQAERYHKDAYDVDVRHGSSGERLVRRANLAFTYAERAKLRYRAGDMEGAESYGRRAASLCSAEGEAGSYSRAYRLLLGNLLLAKAEKALSGGDAANAAALCSEGVSMHEAVGANQETLLRGVTLLATVLRRAGKLVDAARAISRRNEMKRNML